MRFFYGFEDLPPLRKFYPNMISFPLEKTRYSLVFSNAGEEGKPRSVLPPPFIFEMNDFAFLWQVRLFYIVLPTFFRSVFMNILGTKLSQILVRYSLQSVITVVETPYKKPIANAYNSDIDIFKETMIQNIRINSLYESTL